MKRIAYAQVELPDGTLLKRQVVEFSEGKYLCHYPLTEELAFTEWRNEKYVIKLKLLEIYEEFMQSLK